MDPKVMNVVWEPRQEREIFYNNMRNWKMFASEIWNVQEDMLQWEEEETLCLPFSSDMQIHLLQHFFAPTFFQMVLYYSIAYVREI